MSERIIITPEYLAKKIAELPAPTRAFVILPFIEKSDAAAFNAIDDIIDLLKKTPGGETGRSMAISAMEDLRSALSKLSDTEKASLRKSLIPTLIDLLNGAPDAEPYNAIDEETEPVAQTRDKFCQCGDPLNGERCLKCGKHQLLD